MKVKTQFDFRFLMGAFRNGTATVEDADALYEFIMERKNERK